MSTSLTDVYLRQGEAAATHIVLTITKRDLCVAVDNSSWTMQNKQQSFASASLLFNMYAGDCFALQMHSVASVIP
jgi:hypothetical protein